ncbi:MAG: NADPH-dependent F420 reductase [Candidatus Promineifilaceae bacterium]|nr:NADPH-dependent F420 reductase [Candidatus Promineifilaceae bacterium]
MKIAILGGTGAEGFGLGYRWAASGHEIIIGSRKADKGARSAAELQQHLPEASISGTDNLSAALTAEVVVLSVPYAAQEATLTAVREALADKLLITVVAPLGPKKARAWTPPSGLSAAEEAQQQVGPTTRVVAAFQNIGAHHLTDLDHVIESDVLVCGDRKEDKDIVLQLCAAAGMTGINAGPLQNARVPEQITAMLISINIRYKVKSAGIRITGLPRDK